MTYDLRRLRLAGLIHRQPRSNRYRLTDDGIRITIFYTKVYNRLPTPSPQPTNRKHPANYAPHCPQSTDTSRTT
jgi:hypothetical protein